MPSDLNYQFAQDGADSQAPAPVPSLDGSAESLGREGAWDEGREEGGEHQQPASTARYTGQPAQDSDQPMVVIEGDSHRGAAPAAGSGSAGPAAFVPAREQKTIISKRPPASSSSAPPGPAVPHEIGAFLVGQMLDHFELVEFVGGGGMGAVFRAIDTHLGRDVAVKVLSRDQNDEETIRRFKNEAQSAARLDHPNIARVYFVGEALGWNYIVFEFIEGSNIRDLIAQRGQPLPLDEAVNYLLQIAQAIEHASQRDVVHRDIKPSNILITPDRKAKLVDMGLARLHQVESSDNDLTASGVTLGTFDYISPEQARDPRSADVRSDLYSLGCTFYYMLTGRPPFPEGTVLQKLLSHTSDDPPDVRLYRPDLPEEVIDILARLLAKNPKQRYQQPSELIGHLVLLAEHYGWADVAPGSAVWVAAPETVYSRLERLAPIVLPIVMLIGLVALMEAPWKQRPVELEPPRPVLLAGQSRPTPPAMDRQAEPNRSENGAAANLKEQGTAGADSPAAGGPRPPEAAQKDGSSAPGVVGPMGNGQPPSRSTNTGPEPSKTGSSSSASGAAASESGAIGGPNAIQGAAGGNTSASSVPPAPVKSADAAATPTSPLAGAAAAPAGSTASSSRAQNTAEPSTAVTGAERPSDQRFQAAAAPAGNGAGQPAAGADASRSAEPTTAAQTESTGAAGRRAAPGPQTRKLIVGAATLTPGEDAFVVGSLAAALRHVAELPNVEAIELWFDGPRVEPPLAITARRLAIRAGAGYSPVLVIEPPSADFSGGALFRLSGGDFSFSGLHLWCELPATGNGAWSLFQLDRVVSAELAECTVTLRNADEQGRDRQAQAAFFELRPPPLRDPVASEMSGAMPETMPGGGMAIAGMPTGLETSSNAAQAPATSETGGMEKSPGGMATSGMAEEGAAYGPTAIRLSRCLVRGEATLVSAERAQPFSLQWNQGLFISNRRLLEIGAAVQRPEWGAPVEVDLTQVTVFAALGMCLMTSHADAMYPLPLNLDSRYCIFLADPSAPLIEHRGVHKADFAPSLYVAGIDNFYPTGNASQVYWRKSNGPSSEDHLIDRRDPRWCAEMNPQRSVLWASPPDPSKPIHARDAADYLLSRHSTNRAAHTGGVGGWSGFTPNQIPQAPTAPALGPLPDEP